MAGEGIASHYSTGGLFDRLLDGLRAAGRDPDGLKPEDLVPAEHFHTGGAPATAAFIGQLDLGPGKHVLDIGCGIGGVSRAIAHATGASVTGVDLTPDFVATARALSDRVGLAQLTEFHEGSATDLPIKDRYFDLAVLVHVGMNIADKNALFAEAFRALHPGAMLAVYEVMSGPTPGPFDYPLPWASTAAQCHVTPPATYRDAGLAAGFTITRVHNLRDAVMARLATADLPDDPGPFGPHLMMGPDYADKIRNYNSALRAGRLAPVEMFFTRPVLEGDDHG